MIEVVLPYPPSANTYYRSLRSGPMAGRVLISEKGREYRAAIKALLAAPQPLQGTIGLELTLYPPDRRRRDIDNVLKPLLDALTHAGAWLDDSQVKRLTVVMTDRVVGAVEVKAVCLA